MFQDYVPTIDHGTQSVLALLFDELVNRFTPAVARRLGK